MEQGFSDKHLEELEREYAPLQAKVRDLRSYL
jgi:hypothetical protein